MRNVLPHQLNYIGIILGYVYLKKFSRDKSAVNFIFGKRCLFYFLHFFICFNALIKIAVVQLLWNTLYADY